MKRLRRIGKLRVYRSITIVGLLLGLFISSGEGVRLFPIPTNPAGQASTQQSDAKNAASERYNIGVRQTRTFSAAKIKSSKRPLTDSSAAVPQDNADLTSNFYSLRPRTGFEGSAESYSDEFGLLPSGRAPPLS